MPRVLIADQLSSAAEAIFRERGLEVDTRVGMKPAELIATIGDYDGLAIRSATKVTPAVLEAAVRLKVVGRAGIGVDNIDVEAATERGVVVMNTPLLARWPSSAPTKPWMSGRRTAWSAAQRFAWM